MDRKPLFNVIRRLVGRGLRQAEVAAIDDALDRAMAGARHFASTAKLTVSTAGIALIKQFEGCARLRPDGLLESYPDPGTGGAPWTIGWGTTGKDVARHTVWTQAQCDARLEQDLHRYGTEVIAALGDIPTTQAQFDALVCFHYNTGAIRSATLTRRHREGDHAAAMAEFARWNRAGGRILAGLVRRRAAEARLYASGQMLNSPS